MPSTANAFDLLNERGLIKQVNHEDDLKYILNNGPTTFYIGFDPTADSLHVGHFVSMMIMSYLQKCGHKPIVLIGGGTGMVGDPSGKTEMRKIMTKDQVQANVDAMRKQMEKFLSFEGDNKAIIVNNADWLLDLNYIEFIRSIGVHFSVNRMLAAECYKQRLEVGLSFFELNYMLMQSYDFLRLYEDNNCKLQLGGDDQWSNILAGADLVRKLHQDKVCCMTFPLLLTSEGKKMGKTVSGALWLDENKTSVYEFYQYWRNVKDADVGTILRMLTFLPIDEIKRLENLEGSQINKAKEIAAFEITKIVHGEIKAKEAEEAAKAVFENGGIADNMPSTSISKAELESMNILDLLIKANLVESKSQARTLIAQGGIFINETCIIDVNMTLGNYINENNFIIRKGKKTYHKIDIN